MEKFASFGEALGSLIKQRYFNVEDLAQLTGMSRASIYRHLSGETLPSATDRGSYARAFEMTLRELDAMWQPGVTPPQDERIQQLEDLARENGKINLADAMRIVMTTGDQLDARNYKSAASSPSDQQRGKKRKGK